MQNKILQKYPNIGGELAMTTNSENAFRGDGNTSRVGMLDGIVTCKVVDVHPKWKFGCIWLEGSAGQQGDTVFVSISGIVRPQDIRNDNTIASDLIAEAIEYTGTGVVGDKQSPGSWSSY